MQKLIIVILTLFIYSTTISQTNFHDLISFPSYSLYPNQKEKIVANKIHTIISVNQHFSNDTLHYIDSSFREYDKEGNMVSNKIILTTNLTRGKFSNILNLDLYTYNSDGTSSERILYSYSNKSKMITMSEKTSYDNKGNKLYCLIRSIRDRVDFSKYDTSLHKNLVVYDTVDNKIVWEYNDTNKGKGMPAMDNNKIGYFIQYGESKDVYNKKNQLIEGYDKRENEEYKLYQTFEYDRKGRLITHKEGGYLISTFDYKKDKIIEYRNINNKEPEVYVVALLNSQKQVTQILKPDTKNKLNKDFVVSEEYSYNTDGTIHSRTSYHNFPDRTKTKIVHSKTVETFTYL